MSEVTTREPLTVVAAVKEDDNDHLEPEIKKLNITQDSKEHIHDDAFADYPGTTQETRLHYKPVSSVIKNSESLTNIFEDQQNEVANSTEEQTAVPDVDKTVS